MKNKYIKAFVLFFTAALSLMTCCGNIKSQTANNAYKKTERVMLPLADTIEHAGFKAFGGGETVIYKNGEITLQWNKNDGIIKKDRFSYYLGKVSEDKEGILYVEKPVVEKIVGKRIITENNEVLFEDFYKKPHQWTDGQNILIAHACGGINGLNGNNCLEALVTNYNNGQTVFEVDLLLTTDSQVIAAHDWERYGGAMTREEFMETKIYDVFTPVDLDSILQIMQINKEIYIVTDTKSYDDDAETIKKHFTALCDKAKSYDPELLKRIVPQIYNQEMYWFIKEVYPFESIIYTLYASPDTDSQVVDFVKDKDDIIAITMGPVRFNDMFYNELLKYGKLIYLFTINDIDEARGFFEKGVRGIYTDFILPSDI